MSDTFKSELALRAGQVDDYLKSCLNLDKTPPELKEAMNYSLMAGGKRIRPILCLVWGEMLGVSSKNIMPFAAGLEMIHTYSLVHDDLPAMDNDDLRRGKPTSHKKFGEAMAILAGDALLTHAFTMMFNTGLPAQNVLNACRTVADASGPEGMVGGQCLDMDATGRDSMILEDLQGMHAMKTGALLRASCCSGAILAGSDPEEGKDTLNAWEFGGNIGLAFQIVDDILDVIGDEKSLGKPVGSDQSVNKSTYPRFLGLEKSRKLAQEASNAAKASLGDYHGSGKDFLNKLAQYIVDRAT
ncbi:polyprenyl synthetase family protein [Desulfonatronospira sp.]|uniref:polyprenyl synthetase family protein n=1 Tax=Desulfonatronospira sp. TaxID=1962951 RepID=UPI0025C1169E|nr:farnesyl diphosphate synthase [Desulfonatronospira sp.]